MTLLGSTPPQIRTQLRNQLIAAGVPAAEADQAVDLGIHAAEVCRETLVDIVDRGTSTPVKTGAFSIAVGLVTNALSGAVEAMMADAARRGRTGITINARYGGLGASMGGPDHG